MTQKESQIEFKHMLLEYNQEQAVSSGFHYNYIRNRRPKDKPETFGWETIAYTFEMKADPFVDIIVGENDRRVKDGKEPLTTKEVRMKWREYCYIYNYIVTQPIDEEYANFAKKTFKSHTALARLGNGHFSDEPEFNESDYDPMSFIDANF